MKRHMLLALILAVFGCGGEDDRQEVLSKLRGIGVAMEPLVAAPSLSNDTPSQSVATVYVALPIGQTAEVEPYADEASLFDVNLSVDQISIQPETIKYEPHAGFQIMSFQANINVPDASKFVRLGGSGRVRYGFLVKSGAEVEKMVGNFLVFPDGAPERQWKNPEITIVAPEDSATLPSGSKVDLTANVSTPNDEELKLGWFASGGEISLRRAKSTKWKTPAAGEHTLILTVRGKKSRGFAMKPIKVQTE